MIYMKTKLFSRPERWCIRHACFLHTHPYYLLITPGKVFTHADHEAIISSAMFPNKTKRFAFIDSVMVNRNQTLCLY